MSSNKRMRILERTWRNGKRKQRGIHHDKLFKSRIASVNQLQTLDANPLSSAFYFLFLFSSPTGTGIPTLPLLNTILSSPPPLPTTTLLEYHSDSHGLLERKKGGKKRNLFDP